MWYSSKFWKDVCEVEIRARWNAKQAREGRGNMSTGDDDMISQTSSLDYNQKYIVPAKEKSNIHHLSGTLQAGYSTPDSYREYRESRAASRAGSSPGGKSSRARSEQRPASSDAGGSVASLNEITDLSYFYAPSCGYFRLGQLNPMNNNSAQFAGCVRNRDAQAYYEGYDWRFANRVKRNMDGQKMADHTYMRRSRSDAELMLEVQDIKKAVREFEGPMS